MQSMCKFLSVIDCVLIALIDKKNGEKREFLTLVVPFRNRHQLKKNKWKMKNNNKKKLENQFESIKRRWRHRQPSLMTFGSIHSSKKIRIIDWCNLFHVCDNQISAMPFIFNASWNVQSTLWIYLNEYVPIRALLAKCSLTSGAIIKKNHIFPTAITL